MSDRTESATHLWIVAGGSSSLVPLPEHGEVTMGRDEDVMVRVLDPGVAPRHAKLELREGEALLVPLADDATPTLLNDVPLRGPALLTSGDAIGLGEASLVFRRGSGAPARATMLSPLELSKRLREESERALRYQRQVAVVVIDVEGPVQADALVRGVRGALRGPDLASWDAARELVLLLPETGQAAIVPAERVLRVLAKDAPRSRAGFAVSPTDGCDADTLLTAARHAARVAQPGEIAAASDAVRMLACGEHQIIVADPAMKRLYDLLRRVAASDLALLVRGETGCGKEIVASAAHAMSPRKAARFVAINCAAVPDSLFESELFGYERGAFSGAQSAKPGLLESAHGGTLFLDEVGELSPQAQAKLLRAIETRRIARLGALDERTIDVRFVAATNRPLEAEIASGRFRGDLYFRLSGATLLVPPLRDRPLDLPVLAQRFLDDARRRLDRPFAVISPQAMHALASYKWPGNVRELKNVMEFAAAVSGDGAVMPEQLGETVLRGSALRFLSGRKSQPEPATARVQEQPRERRFRKIADEIRDLERTRMIEALHETGGIRVRAADLIGMPLRTFVTKLKEYAIEFPNARGGGRAEE